MSKRFQAIKGTRDLLPPVTAVWAGVESTARRIFGRYGYEEIRTPILEDQDLFVRSVGVTTDIVGKEMYAFEDRKGRQLCLRPENTAAVVRAFVEHGLQNSALPRKLFYIGPQFRYERPQRGRYRQFHQIGAELIGDAGPASDAELILMLVRFFTELGFSGLEVQLNSVGDRASRDAYRDRLREYLEPLRDGLSSESQRRLEENPLRILDSKNADDRRLLADAPAMIDSLGSESAGHFEQVQKLLGQEGVEFVVEPRLVRGLDYYTHTVFEIVSSDLGAQDAIVGGGRYDRLVEELGGPGLPAIGFAIGQDRLIDLLPESFVATVGGSASVFVIAIGGETVGPALAVSEELRDRGIGVETELQGRSMKAALKRADRAGARFAVLIGEQELESGLLGVRDLESGEQISVERIEVANFLESAKP